MFEIIKSVERRDEYYIHDPLACSLYYLHSDGRVRSTREYFPTETDAQTVLDKFYPKPKHIWEHGDVFKTSSNSVMMYLHPEKKYGKRKPKVVYIDADTFAYSDAESYLVDVKFLFNVMEKI